VILMMGRYGLAVPRSMTSLSRALLTLEGTLRIIAPRFDFAAEATALVRELGSVDSSVGSELLQHELLRSLPVLRALPEHVDELATQLRSGRLTVRVDRFSGQDERVVGRWVDRALMAAVGGAGALTAALLLVGASITHSKDLGDALRAIGFVGLVFSATLLMRTVAQVLQRERTGPGS